MREVTADDGDDAGHRDHQEPEQKPLGELTERQGGCLLRRWQRKSLLAEGGAGWPKRFGDIERARIELMRSGARERRSSDASRPASYQPPS